MLNIQTPAARNNDPQTSHLAADYATHSGLRAHQARQVLSAVRLWPGGTSYELAREMDCERVLPARRLPELETAGLIRRAAARRCTITGRQAVTWWPILPGEQAVLLLPEVA